MHAPAGCLAALKPEHWGLGVVSAITWYAVRGEFGWEVQQIVQAGLPHGQLVSLAIDRDDCPHIAIYEVIQAQPLDGLVSYITTE